jgi:ectoine hydroxylase-related dioxygenase (phytanoyl-CoA dioxygenase family)
MDPILIVSCVLRNRIDHPGELFSYVGSHQMTEHLYHRKFKGAEEAARASSSGLGLDHEIKEHEKRIVLQAKSISLKTKQFLTKRGDVLFWSPDIAHGGSSISVERTRKSIVTHCCPAEVVPSYFEFRPNNRIRSHRGIAYYASSHYET